MSKFLASLIFAALALASAAGLAQTAVRVRGTITAFDGRVLAVKSREGQDVKIELAEKTSVAYMKALRLEDVRPGTPLGTSAVPGPDGNLIARELHLFSPERGIPGEGHRAWDLEPGSTMTNAMVTAVTQATGGRELSLAYKGGRQQVIVPAGVPVVTAVQGDRSLLTPGEYVVVAATLGADGRITATRIQVSKDGVKPPV